MRPTARFILPALALVLGACENSATAPTAPRAPSAQAMIFDHGSYREQQNITGYNGCTDEVLTGTGDFHAVVIDVTNAAYGYNSGFKMQYDNVKLTGSRGSSFVSSSSSSQMLNANVAGTVAVDEKMTLIGQGQTPNYVAHALTRYTVDANGVPHAVIDRIVAECTGSAGAL